MKYKTHLHIYSIIIVAIILSSCSKGENSTDFNLAQKTYKVSGKVEKGPFISGSTITIQPMNDNMQMLGESYSTIIQNNAGYFEFDPKSFKYPFVEMTANGYFFNEVDGDLSSGTLYLRSLVYLSDNKNLNVNILTHIKYDRILKLIANGKSFVEANQQAQEELLTAFGLQRYSKKDVSSFSISDGSNESAALIAISCLLMSDKSEAALTEYLAKITREFKKDGVLSNETRNQIDKDKKALLDKLPTIENNIIKRYQELETPITVKNLVHFFDWDNDGIAGNEMLTDNQEVFLESTNISVPNEGGIYKIKITTPIDVFLEKPEAEADILPQTPSSIWDNPTEIYEGNARITMKNNIENNILNINISQLNYRNNRTTSFNIYDYMGNIVKVITISQEGNNSILTPKLGGYGHVIIHSMASDMATAFAKFNKIEQYYYHNKTNNEVKKHSYELANEASVMWHYFYKSNATNLRLKLIDKQELNVYKTYLDVFNAMIYYHMIIAWGDIPYLSNYNELQGYRNPKIKRNNQSDILEDLKTNLKDAINTLEEKRNEPIYSNMNSYFFISKDVARILLANIYMYQGNYENASQLLAKVINNGFYRLNITKDKEHKQVENKWINNEEAIFIAIKDINKGGYIENDKQVLEYIPVMTYSDVMLSYAESLYKTGYLSESKTFLNKVVQAKKITVSDDTYIGIKEARIQLTNNNINRFAFMKRNNMTEETYGVDKHQITLPTPSNIDF